MPSHKTMPVRRRALGGLLGSLLGGLGSQLFPIAGVNGADLGRSIGSMFPFKRGGKPKKRKAVKKARGGK